MIRAKRPRFQGDLQYSQVFRGVKFKCQFVCVSHIIGFDPLDNKSKFAIFVKVINPMADQVKQNELTRYQKHFICNQCCFWFMQIVVLALSVTIMTQAIIGYKQTQQILSSTQYQHSLETVWLWNQSYIIDIKVEQTNNCPEGYQPLVNYQWPGSVDGCYCNSGSNGYSLDFVLLGQCSSELIALGCNNINAMAAQQLNMWKGGKLLCYKRAAAMTFYNSVMTTAPTGGTSATMSTCAINQTYQVTTLPGVPCPLTAFSNQSAGASATTLVMDTVNNYKLNFNSQTGYPIAAFKVSEYQFCDFFNTTNISPNKQGTYVLEQLAKTTPCTLTDPRMVAVDKLNEEDFYTNNTRVYQLINTLPAYPTPSVDYVYQLGFVPYPTWSYQCRSNTQYNLQTTTSKILFQDSSNALTVTISIVIPCVALLGILFRIFFIIRHIVDLKSRSSYNALVLTEEEIAEQMPNLDIKKSFCKQFVIFLIETLLIVGIAVGIIYSIVVLTNESVWIKQITKAQCTDNYIQAIFYYYQGTIDQVSNLLVETTFLWGVLFIVHLAQFITRNSIGDLYTKQSEKVQTEKAPSMNSDELKVLEKEVNLDGYRNPQDSSQVILQKEDNSELKVYDMDYLMGEGEGAGETKDNFFGSLDREASVSVSKKKKKKRVVNTKKKNLFASSSDQ